MNNVFLFLLMVNNIFALPIKKKKKKKNSEIPLPGMLLDLRFVMRSVGGS